MGQTYHLKALHGHKITSSVSSLSSSSSLDSSSSSHIYVNKAIKLMCENTMNVIHFWFMCYRFDTFHSIGRNAAMFLAMLPRPTISVIFNQIQIVWLISLKRKLCKCDWPVCQPWWCLLSMKSFRSFFISSNRNGNTFHIQTCVCVCVCDCVCQASFPLCRKKAIKSNT